MLLSFLIDQNQDLSFLAQNQAAEDLATVRRNDRRTKISIDDAGWIENVF